MVLPAGIEIGKIPVVANPWDIIPSAVTVAAKEVEVGLVPTPPTPPTEPPAPIPPGVFVPYAPYVAPEKKSLIINVETNGYNPWEHRILAIGLQDPTLPEEYPIVIMLEDEELMIKALFTAMKEMGVNELIGYGLSFDYRFLFIKAMKYNIDCKEFVDCSLYDLMQVAAQVKQAFVYYPQKAPSLSDLADYLWGFPKPFTDIEMIKFWASGEFDKVIEFTSSQITRILALYLLSRKVSENSFVSLAFGSAGSSSSLGTTLESSTSSKLTFPEAHLPETWLAKCPNDMSEWNVPITQSEFICPIDGTIIRRK